MQTEQVDASVRFAGLTSTVLNSPRDREMIIDTAAYKRGLDYPCGCRHCRELKTTTHRPAGKSIARIDVYELPDGVEGGAPDYFH